MKKIHIDAIFKGDVIFASSVRVYIPGLSSSEHSGKAPPPVLCGPVALASAPNLGPAHRAAVFPCSALLDLTSLSI